MEDQDLYLQNILNKEFSITTLDSDGESNVNSIPIQETESNELLLSIQDKILDELPLGKTTSISIDSGKNNIDEIDLSPINDFRLKLEKLKNEIDKVDEIDQRLTSAESYLEEYNELQETFDHKVDALEYKINHSFGKANNTIHKEQKTESVIRPAVFEKISNGEGSSLRELLKKSYNKVFQWTKPQSKAAEQSKNNTISAKLNLRKNFIKQLRGQNSATNPDQLAEELILSLLKPIKGLGASVQDYRHQKKGLSLNTRTDPKTKAEIKPAESTKGSPSAHSLKSINPPKNQSQFKLNAHGTSYQVLAYSDDYKTLELKGSDGKMFLAKNIDGLKLEPIKSLDLNPIQKELLTRGKSLMITSGTDIPYKISMNRGKGDDLYDITTVSMAQFKNARQIKATAVKSVKHKL